MSRFRSDAQLNSRDYFAQSGSDLFTKIMERIGSATGPEDEVSEIREKMDEVRRTDVKADRLGLVRDDFSVDFWIDLKTKTGRYALHTALIYPTSPMVERARVLKLAAELPARDQPSVGIVRPFESVTAEVTNVSRCSLASRSTCTRWRRRSRPRRNADSPDARHAGGGLK